MFEFPKSGNKRLDCDAPKLIGTPTYDVGYSWLEWLIKREYGFKLCFVAAWEQGNDTSQSINVEATVPTDDWELKDLREFTEEGKYEYGTPSLVMNELCANGLLVPGRYIVDICW